VAKLAESGSIQQVDIRSVFPKEDANFTPWLGSDEGMKLLSDTIGLELRKVKTEGGGEG
jgi:hypothetical protein